VRPEAGEAVRPADVSSAQVSPAQVSPALFALHNGARYRTPFDLQVTPDPGARYLVVGGCLAEPIPEVGSLINRLHQGDFLLLNNFDALPGISAETASQYDFQIVHVPLRTILGSAYFRLEDSPQAHEEFLRQTEECLARYLSNAMKLNTEGKLLSFVLGFPVPQQNPLGRFQARYDLRNVMHFVERLNMFIAADCAKRQNAHFVDVDQISAGLGKQHCQDDAVWSFTHGTTLSDGDHDHDLGRIHAPEPMQKHYSAKWLEFFEALMREILAMYRTVGQRDAVKLVAVDLDDTLWRGVAAEGTLGILEGWPMGLMETLLILKKRGILLAIVSKNDESFVVEHWDGIVQGHLRLSDFATRRINFRPKAENLAEILRELNLRPQNALMIDDNPVERAAVSGGLPGLRTLGSHPYYLKRILLWSAETQQPALTGESVRRTEMAQAQVRRETVRMSLPHDEFLSTLELRARVARVRSVSDLHMKRALELLNRTNQFNTTGARHTLEQCHRKFELDEALYVMTAEDRFTQYGLIGAAWTAANCIDQLVMSCRALGLGLEDAFLAYLAGELASPTGPKHETILGRLLHTEANMACRPVYGRNGFIPVDGDPALWRRPGAQALRCPPHVALIAVDAG
jgi:FkbH-like protein